MNSWEEIKVWVATVFVALVGRTIHYAIEARDGKFRWTWALLWDVPISIFTGLCAGAIAQGFGLNGNALLGVAAVAGHLGPQFIKSLLQALVPRRR